MTTCGTVIYDNVNHAIELDTRAESNIYKCTEYKIGFSFKQGYSYTIKLNAWCNTPTSPVPNSKMRVDFNSASNGSGVFCNGVESFNITSSLTIDNNLPLNPSVFSDYSFHFNSLSQPQSFLYIGGFLPYINGTATSWILIKKVSITEIPPPVSFTLSPSNLTIPCGSITPQTFRVTNVYNTPNVANYRWNLGANNGWLYNGIAAPDTISTGAVDSLMLTPACSDVKHNISVTVTAGGNNYQTNSVSVSNSSPTLSINGSSAFCLDSSSYFLDGVPCRASVSWISSNTSIATVTSTGNPATLTKTGDGTLTLTATVNGVNCLSNNAALKSVAVGAPQANNISLWNSAGSITIGQPVGFVAGYPPANRCQIQSTEWQVLNMGYSIYTGNFPCEPDNETSKNIFLESEGTAYVQARIQNSCGWSNWSAAVPIQVSSGYYFLVSPNPATSTIAVSPKATTTDEISEIRIYDNMGNLKKQMRYSKGTKRTQLNIGDLGNGYYFIEVIASQKRDRQQLIIQR